MTSSLALLAPVPALPDATYEATFDATAAERAALDPTKLVVIYTDVMGAASRARSAAQRAHEHEERICRISEVPDLRRQLIRFADAASGSHIRYVNAEEAETIAMPDMAELRRMRQVLTQDVKALRARNLYPARRMQRLLGTAGNQAIARDVLSLASGLLQSWKELQGRTGATREELEHLHHLAQASDGALGLRADQEKVRDAAADARQRAFTLLDRLYREMTRVMTFILWWEGPAAIATTVPPFQSGRPRRGKAREVPVETVARDGFTGHGDATANGTTGMPEATTPTHVTGQEKVKLDPFE